MTTAMTARTILMGGPSYTSGSHCRHQAPFDRNRGDRYRWHPGRCLLNGAAAVYRPPRCPADPDCRHPTAAKLPLKAAVVLPPREGFGPGRTGAIGLLVAPPGADAGFPTPSCSEASRTAQSSPASISVPSRRRCWPLGNTNIRYAAAVAEALKSSSARPLVEVHNRPEIALAIAARLPEIPVAVFLHNDPQGMREAASASRTSRHAATPGAGHHRLGLPSRTRA